jgi:hypothetical protein
MTFYAVSNRPLATLLMMVTCVFCAVSCSLLKPRAAKKTNPSGFIAVRLASPVPKRGHTYVQATQIDGRRKKTVGFQLISTDGSSAFVVPSGETYEVCIFCDLNRNESPDENEPIAHSGFISPQPLTTPENVALVLDFGRHAPVGVASNSAPQIKRKHARSPEIDRRMDEVPEWIRHAVGE